MESVIKWNFYVICNIFARVCFDGFCGGEFLRSSVGSGGDSAGLFYCLLAQPNALWWRHKHRPLDCSFRNVLKIATKKSQRLYYWPYVRESIGMMTSSNGNIFRVTGPLCGEFTGPGEFPTKRPVTRSFDVYFDLRLNKRLSKQSWGWWLETLSWS